MDGPCSQKLLRDFSQLSDSCDAYGRIHYHLSMETNYLKSIVLLLAGLSIAACGNDDKGPCDPLAQTGCEAGLTCENVEGAEPACFAPVVVRGQVSDLLDGDAVGDANVVALDVNGAAVSSVAVSDSAGDYELTIPSTRQADGTPYPVEMTLRADASGYQTFPSGLRQALPIDTASAVDMDGQLVVRSALTDIGLLALPPDSGAGIIRGTVDLPEVRTGILVVATGGDGVGYAGVANLDGDYQLFNLPAGSYEVQAYARGVNYVPGLVDLPDAGDEIVDLALDGSAPGIVMGDVQIVNAGGEAMTSVILAVESTFDDYLGRGKTVPGLRAPDPGVAPNITGAYEITGVPAGRYVVLAAFENDNLVRDPDLSIGGTATLHIEVMSDATTTVDGFKVTEALEVFGPGADAPELVGEPLMLSWKDDSSEDQYLVEVFDAFGELIWDTTTPGYSGDDPSILYEGPALVPGMYYQFRVTSSKDGTPISRTEDLKGVFYTE